jgi:2-polyprenyl-3-methyl-5-hydroxy-6-metoxy-1,4-benzoquinol methylase
MCLRSVTNAPICRLCGSPQVEEVISEEHDLLTYHLVRCRHCDLIQTVEHYAALSPDYVDLETSALDASRLWCQGTHKFPAFEQWLAYASRFAIKKNQNLLDVGCGTGGFLKFASANGFRVYGFDASRAQAEYARTLFPEVRHANSIQNYLDLLDQTHLRFNCITLWDVFEHIRNPIPFLQQVAEALEPGGHLFISVPNGRAIPWKIRVHRALNRPLDLAPWEHVFYHSIQSLHKCIRASSLEAVDCGAVACYPRFLSLFELCRRAGFFMLRAAPNLSPQIFVWARKP